MATGDILKISKFLNYTELPSNGATIVVGVGNNSGDKLGYIKWRVGWRRYVFLPMEETVFDAACLTDITEFINKLMADRKGDG